MADEGPLSIRPPPLTLHRHSEPAPRLQAAVEHQQQSRWLQRDAKESCLARRGEGGARAREHLASGARPGKASGRDQADSASPQRLSCKVDGARCLLSQARIPPPAKTCERLQVGVIGAGMAGLYAAMLIKSLGIDFEELEAAEAPGGRVRTHHFSEEERDYVDLGAMRVPKIPIMDRVVGNVPWSLTNKLPGIKLGDYYESDGHGITM